jgi:hypothetical protein
MIQIKKTSDGYKAIGPQNTIAYARTASLAVADLEKYLENNQIPFDSPDERLHTVDAGLADLLREPLSKGFRWVRVNNSSATYDKEWFCCGQEIMGAYQGEEAPFTAYVKGKAVGEYLSAAAAKEAVERAITNVKLT